MARKLTILEFADRLEKIATPKQLNKAILPPFRKGLKIMQRALYAEYWASPFGARIWKWRKQKWGLKGGPSVKLGTRRRRAYARWSHSQGAYIAQIKIGGLAAKMEEGGKLRKHVFWGKGSRSPGLAVPGRRVFDRVVEQKLWGRTVDDIADSFGKFIERTL